MPTIYYFDTPKMLKEARLSSQKNWGPINMWVQWWFFYAFPTARSDKRKAILSSSLFTCLLRIADPRKGKFALVSVRRPYNNNTYSPPHLCGVQKHRHLIFFYFWIPTTHTSLYAKNLSLSCAARIRQVLYTYILSLKTKWQTNNKNHHERGRFSARSVFWRSSVFLLLQGLLFPQEPPHQ